MTQQTVLFCHTDEIEIIELADDETNLPENHKYNGDMPSVNTQPSLTHSPPEDTLVASAEAPLRPCAKAEDTALQACEGDLQDIPLLGTDYMIYGVY